MNVRQFIVEVSIEGVSRLRIWDGNRPLEVGYFLPWKFVNTKKGIFIRNESGKAWEVKKDYIKEGTSFKLPNSKSLEGDVIISVRAAGKIHSDIERGFIRAEVIGWKDLIDHGSEAKCREAGVARVEGKDYLIQDGDVVHFRFNV